MEDKNLLLENIGRLHTTEQGEKRILSNLGLTEGDPVAVCKKIILDENCNIYQNGKNWYCEKGGVQITVNAGSYTIITVHKIRRN